MCNQLQSLPTRLPVRQTRHIDPSPHGRKHQGFEFFQRHRKLHLPLRVLREWNLGNLARTIDKYEFMSVRFVNPLPCPGKRHEFHHVIKGCITHSERIVHLRARGRSGSKPHEHDK